MPVFEDLTGQKFNRLTVIRYAGKRNKNNNSFWTCLCECGNEKDVSAKHLKSSSIKSCGCLAREVSATKGKKHGMSNSRPYNIWANMIQRCTNPKKPDYKFYGAIGIQVCPEWNVQLGGCFENFWHDMSEGYSDGLTLDRIDPYGNYCKENCRWATRKEQGFNQKRRSTNKTGRTGVSRASCGKWQVTICNEYVGIFEDFEAACLAREQAEIERFGYSKV